MKLTIENFAKISYAEVRLDGVTVIGGENNTGKSTVGRVLYSIFRGTSNIERRVREERINAIREVLASVTRRSVSDQDCLKVMEDPGLIRPLLVEKFKHEFGGRNLEVSVGHIDQTAEDFANSFESRVRTAVENVLSMPSTRVEWLILRRVFNCVFHGQYHPLKAEIPPARIAIEVQRRTNEIRFHHDHADLVSDIDLFAHAIMLTDPDVLDYVNVKGIESNPAFAELLDKNVYELVHKLVRNDSSESSILEEHRKEFIVAALTQLDEMINGQLGVNAQGELILSETGNAEPTKVQNLSMGMKSLLLLRTLLSKGILSEKDVLILDEPENHLHPEWQVYYAKALILIQKAYNLTMLVTSHSQFFVNALQRFVISDGLVQKAHFYLSKRDEERPGYCTMVDKGAFSSDLFRSFNEAYDKISMMSGEVDQDNGVRTASRGD